MRHVHQIIDWNLIVSCLNLIVIGVAAYFAYKIGERQNQINDRVRLLQDYVAIACMAIDERIKILNVGKINLYILGFDIPDNVQRFENEPRLIPAGTLDAAHYLIHIPNFQTKKLPYTFKFKLYLKDQFDEKFISENAGEAFEVFEKDEKGNMVKLIKFIVWSYKTYKSDWNFK